MTAEPNTPDEPSCYRHRIEYETNILNSRTNIVLVLNGLAAVAANLDSAPQHVIVVIAVVIILVNVLWIVCARESRHYLKKLTIAWWDAGPTPDEKIRNKLTARSWRLSPTRFISFVVPVLLLMGWIAGLLLASCDISVRL